MPGQPANAVTVEESKFLGGDVDHTHLVKGLDYALLQKVRERTIQPIASLLWEACMHSKPA